MRNCPRCGLINPTEASRCDCGHDFLTGALQPAPGRGLGFPLASVGDRVAAHFLDGVLAYGGWFLSAHILSSAGVGAAPAMIPFVLYALLADGMGDGQSFGKRLMKIAVVDETSGTPCTYGRSLVRNLLRFLGVLDWAFVFGAKHQRLGDRAAGTVVVKSISG